MEILGLRSLLAQLSNFGDCLDLKQQSLTLQILQTARNNLWLGGLALLNYENPPQGYMINGKIDVTVANSDLTVAIKTLSGNNQALQNLFMYELETLFALLLQLFPLQEMTVQTGLIQEVLNLQTSEVDYFVYLGYNATDGVVIDSLAFHLLEDMVISLTTNKRKTLCYIYYHKCYKHRLLRKYRTFQQSFQAVQDILGQYQLFTSINLIQKPIFNTRLYLRTSSSRIFSSSKLLLTTDISLTWTWVQLKDSERNSMNLR